MSGNKKANYVVGYAKPPVSTRFTKGVSGNPSGRPKAARMDLGMTVQAVNNEPIFVLDNGKRKRMPAIEVGFRRLLSKAVSGDLRAARLAFQQIEEAYAPEVMRSREIKIVVQDDVGLREQPSGHAGDNHPLDADDNVGHQRPPQRHRFKKGYSANPRGRPPGRRAAESGPAMVRRVICEPIKVEHNGERIVVTRWEALLRQLQAMALREDHGAARLLQRIRKKFPGDLPRGEPITVYVTEAEMKDY